MLQRLQRLLTVGAIASLIVVATPAPADAIVVFSGPGGFIVGYTPPVAVTPVGGPLEYINGDIQPHNVIAYEDFLPKKAAKKTPWCKGYGPTKCPIFWSRTVPLGGTTTVEGLDNLTSGSQYVFFCSVHPGMKGTLVAV